MEIDPQQRFFRFLSSRAGSTWLDEREAEARRRFLDDPACRVFVMNSEAGGTGNDGLQKVARYMVFYESPTPVITRKQTEKRVHRPGQKERVFIYDLALKRSVDGGILTLLAEGKDLYSSVVGASQKSRKGWLLGD